MANWCTNYLEITGEPSELKQLIEVCKGKEAGLPTNMSFSAIVPSDKPYTGDWCIDNWGTKWESDVDRIFDEEIENGILSYQFETAWGVSLLVSDKLATLFPELKFKHTYYEMNMDYSGVVEWENGIRISEKEGTYEEYAINWEDEDDF